MIADLGDYLLRNQSGQARNNRLSDTEISKRVKASIADDIANPLSLSKCSLHRRLLAAAGAHDDHAGIVLASCQMARYAAGELAP